MQFLNETIAIPHWVMTAAAATIPMLFVLARRAARGLVMPVLGIVGLGLACFLGTSALDRVTVAQQLAQRRALDQRRLELFQRTTDPNSPLVCLSGLPSAPVESACANKLFATPQAAAQALDFAAAELTLLEEGLAYATRIEPSYATALAGMRRAVEHDAYGIFSQVLAARDGCTPENCAAFGLLSDASTVKIHLQRDVFASYVARHGNRWAEAPVATTQAPPEQFPAVPPELGPVASAGPLLASNAAVAQRPAAQPALPVAGTPLTPLPRPAPVERNATAVAARGSASAGVVMANASQAKPAATAPSAETSPVRAARLENPAAHAGSSEHFNPASGAADVRPAPAAPASLPHRVVPPVASVLHNLDFPSSKSIPSISIMQPEPRTPVPPPADKKPSSRAPAHAQPTPPSSSSSSSGVSPRD